ncbi:MAG: hypothetical protein HY820_09900 [Acidobacteria bacterium]|nr:hypothetical protein [Acidobacteriota bacterium]
MQPAVVKVPILFEDVMEALARITAHNAHAFWPMANGLTEVLPEIRRRVMGHQQLTDAVLDRCGR